MSIGYMSVFFFFKQKTAYEMRISDWSSDVCSSDLSRDNTGQTSQRCTQCHDANTQTLRVNALHGCGQGVDARRTDIQACPAEVQPGAQAECEGNCDRDNGQAVDGELRIADANCSRQKRWHLPTAQIGRTPCRERGGQ